MKSSFKLTPSFHPSRSKLFAAIVLLVAAVGLIACSDGKIPFDEARAREQIIPVKQGQTFQDSFVSARAQLSRLITDSTFLARKFNLPNAETFNRDAIAALLNAPGADGVRVYLGTGDKGELRLVLVPVDKNGKDIIGPLLGNKTALNIPGIPSAYAQNGGDVVENGQVCPPCEIGK